MSSENEDLRQQIVELRERVARLEARLADPVASRTPLSRATAPPAIAGDAPRSTPHASPGMPLESKAVEVKPIEVTQVEAKSLENRIGSQLFNRVGIIAVLVGVAWFLKLAVDNGWI